MSSAPGTRRLDLPATQPGASPLVPPDPPLVDHAAGIRLRPWTASPGDVAALAAAWADPVLAAANGVPDDASIAAASRWLAGDADRRAAGRCLDLVVSPLDGDGLDHAAVLGEVGLRNIDQVRRRAETSWWIAGEHRRQGLATAATRLLVAWALAPAGGGLVQVWARIGPDNTASARVATAAGLERRGAAAGTDVWVRSRG